MSDGTPTIGERAKRPTETVQPGSTAAKQAKVPVDTIAFGTPDGTIERQGETIPVPADPEAMAQIASGSGGKSFTATTGTQLKSVYDQIRKSVGYDTETHDISYWFSASASCSQPSAPRLLSSGPSGSRNRQSYRGRAAISLPAYDGNHRAIPRDRRPRRDCSRVGPGRCCDHRRFAHARRG